MDNINELNMNEMEAVVGGGPNDGGYVKYPAEKSNCWIYQIQRHDTLGKIARENHTTVQKIMRENRELVNENFIVTGHYIYIPY